MQEEYGIVVDNGPPLLSVEIVSPFLPKDAFCICGLRV